jgi:hypothetical protein
LPSPLVAQAVNRTASHRFESLRLRFVTVVLAVPFATPLVFFVLLSAVMVLKLPSVTAVFLVVLLLVWLPPTTSMVCTATVPLLKGSSVVVCERCGWIFCFSRRFVLLYLFYECFYRSSYFVPILRMFLQEFICRSKSTNVSTGVLRYIAC